MKLSEKVDHEAEALASGIIDPAEKHRVGRISVNCRLHRIKMLLGQSGNGDRIRNLISSVEHHPDYISENNKEWREDISYAMAYAD